jgi:hypothetical protein
MLTLELPPEIETRLKDEALRQGLRAEEYARRLIVKHLPPAGAGQSLSDLFATWETEDAVTDPAEVARRDREVEALKETMNRNRREMEGPGSRTPFP